MTVARALVRDEVESATDESAACGQEWAAPGQSPVLVVEDEALVREVTVEALTSAGYPVIQAADGAEAQKILETTRLAALVTDVMMPGALDGVAVAGLARRLAPELPILVVSACHGHPRLTALPSDAAFLGKPYSDIQLVSALLGVLRKDRAAA